MTNEIIHLVLFQVLGKTCTTLVVEAGKNTARNNSEMTGTYTFKGKENGRNYYHNNVAKRYLYSSQKGIWFVRRQSKCKG